MQLWYHFGSNLGASNIPRNSMKTRSIQQTFFFTITWQYDSIYIDIW